MLHLIQNTLISKPSSLPNPYHLAFSTVDDGDDKPKTPPPPPPDEDEPPMTGPTE